ncbi:MAG: phage major capsid protein [Bradyrhizobium sp.]|uniref:phage major capsid protein n=1 Tax=Bradyrhizobium sp. TaxID=376 RepID=UPI00272EEDAE|nr:phage major capsid protein [Bradyrhizobium sp.]MDP1868452.1 phage major capsid protein [Bradyrhizobium sp.]
MTAHFRTRGIFAARLNVSPNAVLNELSGAFASFKQNHDRRQTAVENALDDIAAQMAAFRLGGGLGEDPANTKKAMNAFGGYVKTGQTDAMDALRPQNAATTDNDPSGGYLVPKEIGDTIVRRQIEFSPMRRLAMVRPVNSDSFEQLINAGGGTAAWVGERQARPETDSPNYIALTFVAHEIYANPSVSQKLLDDSAFNIASEVTQAIAEDFDEKEGASFVTGDGVLKPRGFLSYDTPVTTADATRAFGTLQYVPSGVAGALTDGSNNGGDALITVVYKLKAGYRRNAIWLMNSATAGTVRKFKDLEGRYLWQDALAQGQPPTLCGYPVEFDENMPDVGANAFPIAFGDWKRGYMIIDRIGVRILRDPYTNKPFVMFYATKRVGGGLLHSDAIKLLKVATT